MKKRNNQRIRYENEPKEKRMNQNSNHWVANAVEIKRYEKNIHSNLFYFSLFYSLVSLPPFSGRFSASLSFSASAMRFQRTLILRSNDGHICVDLRCRRRIDVVWVSERILKWMHMGALLQHLRKFCSQISYAFVRATMHFCSVYLQRPETYAFEFTNTPTWWRMPITHIDAATLFDTATSPSSWTKPWQCLGHRQVFDFSVLSLFALSLVGMALRRSEMCANRWEFVTEIFHNQETMAFDFISDLAHQDHKSKRNPSYYCTARRKPFETDLCARRAIIIASIRNAREQIKCVRTNPSSLSCFILSVGNEITDTLGLDALR